MAGPPRAAEGALRGGSASAPAHEVPTAALLATYAVGFASNGVGMMLKVALPLWAIRLHLSTSEIGLAVGMSGLMPFLFSIHGGVLMDRLGTRRVTMAYALATVIACPLYPALPFLAGMIALQLHHRPRPDHGLGRRAVADRALHQGPDPADRALLGRRAARHPARPGDHRRDLGPVRPVGRVRHHRRGGAAGAAGAAAGAGDRHPEAVGGNAAAADGAPTRPRTRLRDLLPNWRDYAGAFSLMSIPAVAFIVVMTILRNSSTGIQTSFYIVYLKDIGYFGTLIGVLVGISEGAGMAGALMAGWWEKFFKPHWVLIGFVIISIAFVAITPILGGIFVLAGDRHLRARLRPGPDPAGDLRHPVARGRRERAGHLDRAAHHVEPPRPPWWCRW